MTPLLWPSTLCLSRSPDAQPEVQNNPSRTRHPAEWPLLGDGFLYGILSASSLDLNSSGPKGPFGLMWLSLSHLVYNSVRSSTQLQLPTVWLLSWLSYIIVQRPLSLWNRMFNHHQAEITVMQFRGHSLPFGFFSLSHFVSQFPPTRFPLLTAIGMCHFLPVHHLEWHFGPGRRSKYNIYIYIYMLFVCVCVYIYIYIYIVFVYVCEYWKRQTNKKELNCGNNILKIY